MSYFNVNDALTANDISCEILKKYGKEAPILVCLGSSKVVSDMAGVLVADILKNRRANIIVFGGSKRNMDKTQAKYIAKYIDTSRLLFIDSGLLSSENKIAVSPVLKLNDGSVVSSNSIIAGTVQMKDNEIKLASITLNEVLNYAKVIADGVCDYLSYLELLNNTN